MHILVSNHHAEVAAFRLGIGHAAQELQVVENNLSALSLIGNRPGEIESLVITEHQDQAVNIDTELFVQNIVPRLLGNTDVVVVGGLTAPPAGVQQVDTLAAAAAIVVRERELAAVASETPPVAVKRNGRHKTPRVSELVTVVEGPSAPLPAPELPASAKPMSDSSPEGELPASAKPMSDSSPSGELPASPEGEAPAARTPDSATTALLSAQPLPTPPPASDSVAPPAVPALAAAPEAQPVAPAARVELPSPQVLPEIPETTRSLADDIRDWNEREREQRGGKEAKERRPATLSELLRSWLPGQRRLRQLEDDLDAAIRAPRLTHCHSVAVISPKGGVGKSFLTYLVGNFLSEVRGDKVIAIDTNPDFGTLADQVRKREEHTVSSLLEEIQTIRHYSDLRRFTSKVESRLEVLAAPADPDVMANITSNEYSQVFEQLHHYYDTVMFDCGTGFRDDITRFALKTADQIVLVSAPLFITTGIVIRAIGYLDQIGCDLSRVTLAVNQVRQEKPLELEYMRSRFGSRLNAIVEIPFDMQLYHRMDRGEFSVEDTHVNTRIAVKQLAGELTRHFE